MMAKTHIVIGTAAAVAVLQPSSVGDCVPVIAGAAVGSLICDLDCRSTPKMRDALYGRIIVGLILILSVVMDTMLGTGMTESILAHPHGQLIFAAAAFIIIAMGARNSAHRGFSHSVPALILYCGALYFISQPLIPGFAIAYLSHLALDLLNKMPVRIFWPAKKGFCLRICSANGLANKVCLLLGCAALVLELGLLLG